jgi:Na+/H+ antiporter NhaC
MGILMPIVIPMTYALVATATSDQILQHPILLGTVGSVLAGAIFGDHCSPISDTTVLSSQSSACDHIAHVKTQMPYSLSLAAINILLGTLPLGLGVSLWLLLVLQMIAIVLMLLLLGRPVESN